MKKTLVTVAGAAALP